jgi:hypothetical protein
MLRQPSFFHSTRREEGCSSTAFGMRSSNWFQVWSNPANRGFWNQLLERIPAVP